jgi:transcriptional regulator GlxA family with amidase domain
VNFNIPLTLLARLAAEAGEAGDFDFPPFTPDQSDTTLLHLASALVPAFSSAGEMSARLGEHILTAVATRLLARRRSEGRPAEGARPGLSLWQQRRIGDFLAERIAGEVSLAELAALCRLSPSHFARSFRATFGLPPHRWLLTERVRRATELMRAREESLDQIALACGFVDQSHFSRVFRRVMHLTPDAWRRAHLD